MGRGRIPMEVIQKEKARNITFEKRKNGLMKKVGEFSTLCGIDVCLIIHGPNLEGQEPKLETWPHDSEEVHRIIDKYHRTTVDRRPKVYDVEEYYKDRMRKIETEISRVHKEKLKLMYPIWDDSFDALGEEQLRMFVSMLDAKLDACNQRINMLKTKPDTLADSHLPPNLNFMQPQPQLFPPPIMRLPMYPFFGQSSQSPMLHNYDQNCVQLMGINGQIDSVNQVDAVTCDPIKKDNGAENNHNTSPFLYDIGNMQTMPSCITQYCDFETSFQPLNGFCDANMPQPPMFNNMHRSK